MVKKGQVEIMGFVMFFLLVVLGIFFLVALTVREKPPTHERFEMFELSKVENAFLISSIEVTTPCQNLRLKDLLDDCVEKKMLRKEELSCGDGKTSCDVSKEILSQLLNNSFKEFGLSYYLEVKEISRENKIFNLSINSCDPDKASVAPALQPLAGPKQIQYILLLYLCKNE